MSVTLIIRKKVGPYNIYERRPKLRGETKYTVGKAGEAELHDFGRYSAAIRYAKQQLPRPVPLVVINIETKEAVSTMPVNVSIIDGPYRLDAEAVVNPALVDEVLNKTPNL